MARRRLLQFLPLLIVAVALYFGADRYAGAQPGGAATRATTGMSAAADMSGAGLTAADPMAGAADGMTGASGKTVAMSMVRSSVGMTPGMARMTLADRFAAAKRDAAEGAARLWQPGVGITGFLASAVATMNPGGQPNYFGPEPNWTFTPVIRKFVDTLPGLGAANANNLGQYIPVAMPVKNPNGSDVYAGSDYYEIGLTDAKQQFNSDLPATKFRGYVDLSPGSDGKAHYLGPLILAQRDRAVRLKFTNTLPTSDNTASNLFIPVDTTVMGAGMGPTGATYTENRANIHLHGGDTPWISDGTPHQWITPAGDPAAVKRGVSQVNVPDMPDPGDGAATLYYPNQHGARLMFYHDHAYGITRLNVYAGEAAPYLLTSPSEETLIDTGAIPGKNEGIYRYGVPLVIQDKTFVPDTPTLAATDPTWDIAKYGGEGSMWFPHVYMPNQDPSDISGANAVGRWDYGAWFWPPVTTIVNGAILDPNGSGKMVPGTPNPSIVPEAFMDTPLVNGTAYPTMPVERKAYRFRILNASNDRFWNLQLYYVDPAHPTEVKMVDAVAHPGDPTWPATWPTDGRAGGVPDPKTAGPEMIQIGTEGGFMPRPVTLPNQPVNYLYDRRNIVVLNVSDKTLFLGPAERADVIVDFSQVPKGSKIIMYNDSPAPVPAFDPRNDYYTGDPDLRAVGGTAPTLEGYGPNTRTIMRFDVGTGAAAPAFDFPKLDTALQAAFAVDQDAPIVPGTAYGDPVDYYSRIQSTTIDFVPRGSVDATSLPLEPKAIHELFELNYGRMNAVLGVELPFTNFLTQTTIPLGYVDPPTEVISNNQVQVWKITHNGVDTHAIHVHLFNVQVINRVGWDGAIRPPDPNEVGWKETVRMNPLEDIIVAFKPVAPTLPFAVPDSVRLLDPTQPAGGTMGFTNVDPTTGNPVTTTNVPFNFGWEYVWHCHLLGHEENDMMRPVKFQVTP